MLKDMTGRRFGRLTVVSRAPNYSYGTARWNCICDCGRTTISAGTGLRAGGANSCGCLQKEAASLNAHAAHKVTWKHGACGTADYARWAGMMNRCYSPSAKQYKNYGARGIGVCPEWHDFNSYLRDMGKKPGPEYSVDRIDNDKDYSPHNCRWATMTEQNRNKRNNIFVEVDGAKVLLAELIAASSTNEKTIRTRLFRGWSLERALS